MWLESSSVHTANSVKNMPHNYGNNNFFSKGLFFLLAHPVERIFFKQFNNKLYLWPRSNVVSAAADDVVVEFPTCRARTPEVLDHSVSTWPREPKWRSSSGPTELLLTREFELRTNQIFVSFLERVIPALQCEYASINFVLNDSLSGHLEYSS